MGQLEDILAIPGNRSVHKRLQKLLIDGSAIAFIGAGASFPLYPLWTELLGDLADQAIAEGVASDADKAYWLRMKNPLQAVSQIRKKLSDQRYHPFLYENFKDRVGPGGLAFTPAQAALARSNFNAWITTNYDGGLIEARRVLRPDIRETGFVVWNQNFQIQRWSNGDLFKEPAARPVLFAHGHFADPANIILDRESYQQAYRQTPYRRLFENLWIEQRLVFVGFSFSDVTLSQIAEDVLLQTANAAGAEPRHLAIVGIDQGYTPEMRQEYLETYHADVLLYPVIRNPTGLPDHSALQVLLESVASFPEPAAAPTPVPATPKRAVTVRFVHETTDDEKFTGRIETLARLDRWAADPKVRLIAITAIGGLGKTALAGRWLRQGRHRRGAVFFWSFYRERDTDEFFEALEQFRRETPGNAAIVLDGLEVMQEVPGSVAYGKLLDVKLSDFLHAHCRAHDGNLVLLTSRFPFPDLTPYLGGALRSLPLTELDAADGAVLLESLDVRGRAEDRERISRDLSGHPLALRLFARSMPLDLNGDPTRLWNRIFDPAHLSADDPLEAKMSHLLAFYEKCLPETHRQALGLIALFRAPVGESTLVPLWEELLDNHETGTELSVALKALHREHLLTADPSLDGEWRYACHPILREHFRSGILGRPSFGREAAGTLAGPPNVGQATSLAEAQTLATAVELLLEAGEITAPHDLYRARLCDAFRWLPAPHLGIEVVGGFLRESRRHALQSAVGDVGLAYYLTDAGLFSDLAGEPESALDFYAQANKICRDIDHKLNLGLGLLNIGEAQVSLGLLADAERSQRYALELARAISDDRQIRNSLTRRAYSACLRGDIAAADTQFSESNAVENRIGTESVDLYSQNGIRWAEHLLRIGNRVKSQRLTVHNIKICLENSWRQTVARCEWILGWLDVFAGDYTAAHAPLEKAKATFTAGHMIQDLAKTLVTESACYLKEHQFDAALASCERALDLAAPRNYRLIHADALNLRARIALDRPDPDPNGVRDDAEAALQLAEWCEYAWAQRDACEILSRAYHALGSEQEALKYAKQHEDWSRRLTLPAG
jgi:tetratricopeptide (TPR) repeat protein